MQRFAHDCILCCEGQGNYVLVRTASGDTLATITLKALRDALPGDQFVQVHKSYIVRREAIAAQDVRSLRLVDGTLIPIGKTYRGADFLTGQKRTGQIAHGFAQSLGAATWLAGRTRDISQAAISNSAPASISTFLGSPPSKAL